MDKSTLFYMYRCFVDICVFGFNRKMWRTNLRTIRIHVSLVVMNTKWNQLHRFYEHREIRDLDIIRITTEKAMAPHSSTLAWRIPWTEEPGRLQSMGSLGVGHDWATLLSLFTFMHWRRKWQPTPVFLPGESQRRGSLVGCCLWGHTESDTTEAT